MKIKKIAAFLAVLSCAGSSALAQQSGTSQPPTRETRPATTTTSGDTGLWFVPTADVLPAKNWSASVYRVNFDYDQGFTDVSRFPITFGVGLADRVELFGSVTAVTRIDRDLRPLFLSTDTRVGGVVNEYPYVNDGWSGNQFGDIWLGAKFNLTSQWRQQPAAFALRGMIKLPTASEDHGAGTGKMDVAFDGIVSKEFNQRVELSGFGGFIFRGDPDEWDLQNGFRWGVGAGFPTRKNLRVTAELHGEKYFDDAVVLTGAVPALFGAVPPVNSVQSGPVNATIGLTWIGRNGFFAGAGLNYNFKVDSRDELAGYESEGGDAIGFQFRLGYHPGVRIYVPPPPPSPPAPPAPAAQANRPPTVRARCEPCTVMVGATSTITADASDPDGDPLTYKWSPAAGRVSNPADRQSPWTAPMQEGPVVITVEVSDGKGGTASDTVTIQVIRPAVKEVVFEDVHFDFDRYSLRPEAVRALDEVIKAMQGDAQLRLNIEGHTCNIGTAEYNLALGERRAVAVRDYLSSRGIGADRLTTVSYGEERPKHDNAREETRRLNRRAALVVRLQR